MKDSNALQSTIKNVRDNARELNRLCLEHDGEKIGFTDEEIDTLVKISEKLGYPIAYVDNLADAKKASFGKTDTGKDSLVRFQNRGIYIDGRVNEIAKRDRYAATIDSILAHEMTHATEGGSGYREFVNHLLELERAGVIKGNEKYIDELKYILS